MKHGGGQGGGGPAVLQCARTTGCNRFVGGEGERALPATVRLDLSALYAGSLDRRARRDPAADQWTKARHVRDGTGH
jgi:hypothetical protein